MVKFIDSHAHIADSAFAGDRSEVIQRAVSAGADAVICIGASLEQASESRELSLKYPGFIHYTAGVHPHDASSFEPRRDIPVLREFFSPESYRSAVAVAVGECGLDYYYDNSPRDVQRRAFAAQLGLAKELGKPVIVHTRDAEEDTMAMVKEAGQSGISGVLHCYTGSARLAEAALNVGWYISFSGIITFKKWDRDDVVKMVPDNRILAESDSPYLAPVPNRGKRNEPAWVINTIGQLARVRGQSIQEVAGLVTENAKTLFSLYVD